MINRPVRITWAVVNLLVRKFASGFVPDLHFLFAERAMTILLLIFFESFDVRNLVYILT